MACETCDHTMQRVNSGEPPVFWCPTCGTIRTRGAVPEFETPKLVERARDLSQQVPPNLAHTTGVTEIVATPKRGNS